MPHNNTDLVLLKKIKSKKLNYHAKAFFERNKEDYQHMSNYQEGYVHGWYDAMQYIAELNIKKNNEITSAELENILNKIPLKIFEKKYQACPSDGPLLVELFIQAAEAHIVLKEEEVNELLQRCKDLFKTKSNQTSQSRGCIKCKHLFMGGACAHLYPCQTTAYKSFEPILSEEDLYDC